MIPHPEETREGSSQASTKPTLEELLRVKRMERPDEDFWADFERGLAHKQLATIVEPRPWWLGLALVGRRVSALGLPVSAAAAALLAIMVVRTESPLLVTQGTVEFGPVAAVKAPNPAIAEVKVVAAVKTAAPVVSVANVQSGAESDALAKDGLISASSPDVMAVVVGVGEPVEGSVAAVDAGEGASLADASVSAYSDALAGRSSAEAPTASQITIAQNLAAVTAEEPELVAAVSPSVAFVEVAASAPEVAAPEVSPRQARLLAMAESPELADADAGIAQVRERMVHRLDSDASNYAEASRLGYRADRLSLSF